eukprot:15980917-Heterocapsa_arctica.AAC.1
MKIGKSAYCLFSRAQSTAKERRAQPMAVQAVSAAPGTAPVQQHADLREDAHGQDPTSSA